MAAVEVFQVPFVWQIYKGIPEQCLAKGQRFFGASDFPVENQHPLA
jgi:hypothetical protein